MTLQTDFSRTAPVCRTLQSATMTEWLATPWQRAQRHPGRRAPGLRRRQSWRVALICRLWRSLCPPLTPRRSGGRLDDFLRDIARHVIRRARRVPAAGSPRRSERRPVRVPGRALSWWQLQSPCDGVPAAARDGTGQ